MQGSRLLSYDKVRAAVAEGRHAIAKRIEVNQDMVLEGMLTEARYHGEGCSHGARVSAWEKLGRHTGTFTAKHDVKVSGNITVQFVQFDRDMLERK